MLYDETTKRAAIYACSVIQSQTARNDASQQQINGCTEYIMQQGYFLRSTNIYQDIVTNIHDENRPQFVLLREAMKRHEIQVVVVYGFNRVAPKIALIETFLVEADQLGIAIESALEPLSGIEFMKRRSRVRDTEDNA